MLYKIDNIHNERETCYTDSTLPGYSIMSVVCILYVYQDSALNHMPWNLGEPQEVVSDFVEFPDEEVVRRAVRDIRPRAEMCIKMGGGHCESQLKKYKRGIEK